MTRTARTSLAVLLCLLGGALDAAPEKPKVLIIGDSISLGYTPVVKAMMSERAEVRHNPGNAKFAAHGRANLDKWLGDTKWDVIHFNWGLWDICYRNPKSKTQGNRDKVNGKLTATPDSYREDLEAIVLRLKKTGAELVWAATTPVPEGEAGRIVGDEVKYNAIAAEIMKKHGVAVNDLHSQAAEHLGDAFVAPGNVHFTKEGSATLAVWVVKAIDAALARRGGTKPGS